MKNEEFKYELMVIVDPDLGESACNKRLEAIKKQISKHGEIFFEDVWGEKPLAYSMNGRERGYYAVINFTFDPTEILEFDTSLRLEPEIMRYLIVKVPFKYTPKTMKELEKDSALKIIEEA